VQAPNAYALLANPHQDLGQMTEAMQAAMQAYATVQELGITSKAVQMRIASLHLDVGLYDKALLGYESCLAAFLRTARISLKELECSLCTH